MNITGPLPPLVEWAGVEITGCPPQARNKAGLFALLMSYDRWVWLSHISDDGDLVGAPFTYHAECWREYGVDENTTYATPDPEVPL